MHGVEGVDSLGGETPIASIARRLPQLRRDRILSDDGRVRSDLSCEACWSRFGAHARPRSCIQRACCPRISKAISSTPITKARSRSHVCAIRAWLSRDPEATAAGETGAVAKNSMAPRCSSEIERGAPDIGIVTIAPEIDGGLDLIKWLTARGLRVSLGHSGATFDEAQAAIAAGARHATHLFNRMPPLDHRRPGWQAPFCRPRKSRRS